MKKFFAAIFAILCASALFAFAGCSDDKRENTSDKIEQGYSICYAFTASSDIMAITKNTTMKDYMDALKEDGCIYFEASNSDYGYFITSVLGISGKPVSSTSTSYSGYDWAVYTTVTSVDGTVYSSDEATFVYDGITLYKSSYGISGLPCIEGQTYALVYEYSSISW